MSEHNRAIRMAQKFLRYQAGQLDEVEVGYQQYAPHPHAEAFKEAADMLEVLVEDTAANQSDGRLAPAVDPEHHAERYSPDVVADQSIGKAG